MATPKELVGQTNIRAVGLEILTSTPNHSVPDKRYMHTLVFLAQEYGALQKRSYDFDFSRSDRLLPVSGALSYDMYAWGINGIVTNDFGHPFAATSEYLGYLVTTAVNSSFQHAGVIDELVKLVPDRARDEDSGKGLLKFSKLIALRKLLTEQGRQDELGDRAQDVLYISPENLDYYLELDAKLQEIVSVSQAG